MSASPHWKIRISSLLKLTGKTSRSFDSGSAKSLGQTNFSLAFAQDDGAFLRGDILQRTLLGLLTMPAESTHPYLSG
jgi:hypothetical protein